MNAVWAVASVLFFVVGVAVSRRAAGQTSAASDSGWQWMLAIALHTVGGLCGVTWTVHTHAPALVSAVALVIYAALFAILACFAADVYQAPNTRWNRSITSPVDGSEP